MAPRAKLPWLLLGSLMLVVGIAGGFLVWLFSVQATDQEIERKQSALTRLRLGGRPPDQQLMDYLKIQPILEQRYQSAVRLVAPMPSGVEEEADLQLHFQQQLHEVQRTLERLSTARGMPIPAQLGFPKELPPAEAVPRFLTQLGLIEESAELLLTAPGISQLISFKVEDPQAVKATTEAKTGFLTRLPVRVRLVCSLQALSKILGMLDRARPLIDIQGLRIVSPEGSQDLEVEFVFARYLVNEKA